MFSVAREDAVAVAMAMSFVVAASAAQVGSTQSQPQPVVITGAVLDFADKPIEGATVSVRFPAGGTPAVSILTPASGRFVATVEPGSYRVSATKPGYMNEARARRHVTSGVGEISVARGSAVPEVVFRLAKYSVVSGTVRDADGQPVASAQVQLLRSWTVGGSQSFEAPYLSTAISARTDDRGEYRLTTVEPGTYIAGVFDGRLRDLATRDQYGLPSLYPGTTDLAAALPFDIGIEEEKSGVDFKLLRAASLSISGRVTGADEPFRRGLPIRIVRSSLSPFNGEFEVARTYVGPGGEFTLSNLTPGNYTLLMADFPRDEDNAPFQILNYLSNSGGAGVGKLPPTADFYNGKPTYIVELPITVDKDIRDLIIPFVTGKQLCGQLEFSGAAQMPPQPRASVQFVRPARINVQLPVVPISPEGRFCSAQMPGGKYLPFVLAGGTGWHLNAVEQGGRNVTGEAIEPGGADLRVLFSNRDADVHGTVTNQKAEPVAGVDVVVFPAESTRWADFGPWPLRLKAARTDAKGVYKLLNLPEGSYRVVALSEPARDDWTLTDNLQRLAVNAGLVEVKPGSSVLLNLVARSR